MKKEIDVYGKILESNHRLIEINNELIKVNRRWEELATKILIMYKDALEKAGDKHEADLQ